MYGVGGGGGGTATARLRRGRVDAPALGGGRRRNAKIRHRRACGRKRALCSSVACVAMKKLRGCRSFLLGTRCSSTILYGLAQEQGLKPPLMRSRDQSHRPMLPFVGTFLCLTHSVPGKQRPRTAAPADLSRTLPMHVNHHACMCLASSFQRQLGSSRALSKVLAAASCSFHDRYGCFVMFPAAVAGLSVALEARRRPGGDDGGGKYGRHVGGLGGRSRRHKVGPAGTQRRFVS